MDNKNNKECHEELLAQLSANRDNVEKLAMGNIKNLESVIPSFNNLGCLTPQQFVLLLRKIKNLRGTPQYLATLVAICLDSFTCMVKNSLLYYQYLCDNRVNLNLLQELLQLIYVAISDSQSFPPEAIASFIAILERSAARIQFQEIEFFNKLVHYIKNFKRVERLCVENQLVADSNAKNKQPIAGVSKCNLKAIIAPDDVTSKHFKNRTKELIFVKDSFEHNENFSTVSNVAYKTVHNNSVCKTNYNTKQSSKQTKITDFSFAFKSGDDVPRLDINDLYESRKQVRCSKRPIKSGDDVPRLYINDLYERKQVRCNKRPIGDVDFVNKKENIQPPIKKLKLETIKNVTPSNVQTMVQDVRMKNGKQLPCNKRLMDTDFVNKQKNVQSAIKKVTSETINKKVPPSNVQAMVQDAKNNNEIAGMASQSLLKKK